MKISASHFAKLLAQHPGAVAQNQEHRRGRAQINKAGSTDVDLGSPHAAGARGR